MVVLAADASAFAGGASMKRSLFASASEGGFVAAIDSAGAAAHAGFIAPTQSQH